MQALGKCLCLLPASAFVQMSAAQVVPVMETMATVYRDNQGVPHIEAEDEVTAWYALGYEEARDSLLWIQWACKAVQGKLTWAWGVNEFAVRSDMGTLVLKARLDSGLTEAQLRALFASTNPAITANFYDNCVAYAAGADQYRREVEAASTSSSSAEGQLKLWLSTHGTPARNFTWAFSDPISPLDIASQGRLTTANMSMTRVGGRYVNASGTSYGLVGGSEGSATELVEEPTPATYDQILNELRKTLSSMPGAAGAMCGSNAFCWSHLYCHDPSPGTTGYSGCLGHPHQPIQFHTPFFQETFPFITNHMWYAHVKVTSPGASAPSLDVFGHVPHAAAVFYTSHNRNIAVGGTLGAPNFANTFVLRLKEDPTTGLPVTPHQYYSYYHDTNHNGGADPTVDWRNVTVPTFPILRPDDVTVQVPYWRVGPFGFVLPTVVDTITYINDLTSAPPVFPVIYGERVDSSSAAPPRWRNRPGEPKMKYWATPQGTTLITSPMVIAFRIPMDDAVAGEDLHSCLHRDFWEINHAQSVWDVISRTNGAAYMANFCCADRSGRTFSTQFSAIPQRGDDVSLQTAGYKSYDKYLFYSGAAGPVLARHYEDLMFDWQFGTQGTLDKPAPLNYLTYPTGNPPAVGPTFKPYTIWDPTIPGSFPPTWWAPASDPFTVENAGFASVCNDLIWGASRKRDIVTPGDATLFNDIAVSNNQLMQMTLDAGTLYQTFALSLEGPDRNQIVVDKFTAQAERIIRGGMNGDPPMTPAQAQSFVVSPKQYVEDDYTGSHPEYPPPIRQVKELVDNIMGQGSPVEEAVSEGKFFRDFWNTLYGANWDTHIVAGTAGQLTLSLRDLWVNNTVPNHANQVFWYDDPSNPSTLRWIDMPTQFPLIDFLWTESEIGAQATVNGTHLAGGLDSADRLELATRVQQLVDWEANLPLADRYRTLPSSNGACLLQMWRQGYTATESQFGRKWLSLVDGAAYAGTAPPVGLVGGQLPTNAAVVRNWIEWSGLESIAFPAAQLASLFDDSMPAPVPPYANLYDPTTGVAKTALSPQDTNALVRFFLELGGYYIDPTHNNGNPSRKLARFQLAANDRNSFLASRPASFPLTRGLARVTAARRLLDAGRFLQIHFNTIPPFGTVFRSRAFDHNGQLRWPASGGDAACVGGGLRSVVWWFDPTVSGYQNFRGFQPRFHGLSGSYATLLALFPNNSMPAESYFWCTPGVEPMIPVASNFDKHMQAFTNNTLMPSHYSDYASNYVSVDYRFYVR